MTETEKDLSIIIDDIKFKLLTKTIIKNTIYIKIISNDSNEFFVYKSNSQGFFRYYSCNYQHKRDCPDKWSDYTTTTMIDFRLQYFIFNNIDNILYHEYDEYDLFKFKSANVYDEDIIKMMNNREEIVPEFEYIYMLTKKLHHKNKYEYKFLNAMINPVVIDFIISDIYEHKKNGNKYDRDMLKWWLAYIAYKYREAIKNIVGKQGIDNIYNTQKNVLNHIYKYDLLKIMSEEFKQSFILDGEPQKLYDFNHEIIYFNDAEIVSGEIIDSDEISIKKYNDSQHPLKKLHPFSKNIEMYTINIKYSPSYLQTLATIPNHNIKPTHIDENTIYKIYYIKYNIDGDINTYYMPLLVTPENTKILESGLPDKYIKAGMFCNKPWDYVSQCFYEKTYKNTLYIYIHGKGDDYAFIGNNYRSIWPWNDPIITGLESKIESSTTKLVEESSVTKNYPEYSEKRDDIINFIVY